VRPLLHGATCGELRAPALGDDQLTVEDGLVVLPTGFSMRGFDEHTVGDHRTPLGRPGKRRPVNAAPTMRNRGKMKSGMGDLSVPAPAPVLPPLASLLLASAPVERPRLQSKAFKGYEAAKTAVQGLTKSSIKRAEGEVAQAEATAAKAVEPPATTSEAPTPTTEVSSVLAANEPDTPVMDTLREISEGRTPAEKAPAAEVAASPRQGETPPTAETRGQQTGGANQEAPPGADTVIRLPDPVVSPGKAAEPPAVTAEEAPAVAPKATPAERPEGTRLRDAAARERQKVVDIQAIRAQPSGGPAMRQGRGGSPTQTRHPSVS
jgi:hypothetical protein